MGKKKVSFWREVTRPLREVPREIGRQINVDTRKAKVNKPKKSKYVYW